jgi:hypothetical protein
MGAARLGQAHLDSGEVVRARQLATKAFADCVDAGARVAGIVAAATLAAALRAEAGLAAAARIEEVSATADRLIADTGARNLSSRVSMERAALAELRGDVPA